MKDFDLTINYVKKILAIVPPGDIAVISLTAIKPLLKGSGLTDKDARKCAAKIAKDTKAKVEIVNKDYIVLINDEEINTQPVGLHFFDEKLASTMV